METAIPGPGVGVIFGVSVIVGVWVGIGVVVGAFVGIGVLVAAFVGVGVEAPIVGVLVGEVGAGVQGGTETPTVVQVSPNGSLAQSLSTTSDMPKMQADAVSDRLPVQVSVAELDGPSAVTGMPPW